LRYDRYAVSCDWAISMQAMSMQAISIQAISIQPEHRARLIQLFKPLYLATVREHNMRAHVLRHVLFAPRPPSCSLTRQIVVAHTFCFFALLSPRSPVHCPSNTCRMCRMCRMCRVLPCRHQQELLFVGVSCQETVPSPTLSPTDPVPRAYSPCAPGPTDPVGQSWHVCVCIYVCMCGCGRKRRRVGGGTWRIHFSWPSATLAPPCHDRASTCARTQSQGQRARARARK
jgi:hypothetical protein